MAVALADPSRPAVGAGVAWDVLVIAQDAFVATSEDGVVLAWNPAATATFGWTEAEALGRRLDELVVPQGLRAAHRAGMARHRAAVRGGLGPTGGPLGERREMPALHRDGRTLTVEITINATFDGERLVYFAFLRDLTERRRAEAEVRWMADVVRTSTEGIVTVDDQGVVQSANAAWERLTGRSAAERIGQPLARGVDPRYGELVGQLLAVARRGGRVEDEPLRFEQPGGDVLDLEISAVPVGDEAAPRGAAIVIRDVTDRREEERRPQDQLGRLRELGDARVRPAAVPDAAGAAGPAPTPGDAAASAEIESIGALLAALDARDHYTGDHSRSVVALAVAVADEMGLDARRVVEVERVALLHDVGKVGVPDTVLRKRGPLNATEWELMREHPAIGERIVSCIGPLAHLAPAIRAEHERWDGGGYPDGLAERAIPVASRIVLACDAWHAMRSDRPYRVALPRDAALAELRANAGTQFDPEAVRALLAVVRRDGATPG